MFLFWNMKMNLFRVHIYNSEFYILKLILSKKFRVCEKNSVNIKIQQLSMIILNYYRRLFYYGEKEKKGFVKKRST